MKNHSPFTIHHSRFTIHGLRPLFVLLVLLFFLLPSSISPLVSTAHGQQWVPTNSLNVAWDQAVVASGDVSYEVYIKEVVSGVETLVGTVTALRATITCPREGKYYAGVRTVRTIDGEVLKSANIGWSNIAEYVADGNTFGIRYYVIPPDTKGLKVEQN